MPIQPRNYDQEKPKDPNQEERTHRRRIETIKTVATFRHYQIHNKAPAQLTGHHTPAQIAARNQKLFASTVNSWDGSVKIESFFDVCP